MAKPQMLSLFLRMDVSGDPWQGGERVLGAGGGGGLLLLLLPPGARGAPSAAHGSCPSLPPLQGTRTGTVPGGCSCTVPLED